MPPLRISLVGKVASVRPLGDSTTSSLYCYVRRGIWPEILTFVLYARCSWSWCVSFLQYPDTLSYVALIDGIHSPHAGPPAAAPCGDSGMSLMPPLTDAICPSTSDRHAARLFQDVPPLEEHAQHGLPRDNPYEEEISLYLKLVSPGQLERDLAAMVERCRALYHSFIPSQLKSAFNPHMPVCRRTA